MPMRARDLHPLCCLPVDCPGGWCSAAASDAGDRSSSPPPQPAAPATVAGLLHKWTNIGKGWRPRWFAILRGGLLAYSKIRRRAASTSPDGGGPRLIGPAGYRAAAEDRPIGFVHLKEKHGWIGSCKANPSHHPPHVPTGSSLASTPHQNHRCLHLPFQIFTRG